MDICVHDLLASMETMSEYPCSFPYSSDMALSCLPISLPLEGHPFLEAISVLACLYASLPG